ncbi:hypothetical protein DEA06_14450 [Microbacterium sp. Gd 4-13]|nr:hypothetical protein DEA06_14450 [Microbacterium sp. Gd 4-13]
MAAELELARSETSPMTLKILGRSKNISVRRQVTRNPAAGPSLLRALAFDVDVEVRLGVVSNSNSVSVEQVLTVLTRDADPGVKSVARQQLGLPPHAT